MPLPVWIAVLHVNQRTATKVASKHGLSIRDIRDAVVCRSGLGVRRESDPDRGVRFYLDTVIHGRPVLVVLRAHAYEVDEYLLVSAYRL